MNILMVDDDEPCRNLIKELFADDAEMTFAFASDGAEAWWLLSDPQRTFDLGIIDLHMPTVTGLSLLERIRATPRLAHFPIMLCTGIHDRETVARAAQLSINHYIVKPFKPAAMREKIEQLRAGRRAGGSALQPA
jgi:two-component system chemotaxis response regulator CheY